MDSTVPGLLGIARVRRLKREGFALLPPGHLDERMLDRSRGAVIATSSTAHGRCPWTPAPL